MLRKIGNYSAFIALVLTAAGTAALAAPAAKINPSAPAVEVEAGDNFSFYNKIIRTGEKHAYTVRVEAGKPARVVVRAAAGVALNVKSPDGAMKRNAAEKFFELKLVAPGEYTVEVESAYFSQYSLEVSAK